MAKKSKSTSTKSRKSILVIGGGPAGLACAHELSLDRTDGFTADIVERDVLFGGLSKTVQFNDYYYDLGGHRFFTKIDEVNKLWDETLKDDFIVRPRLSRIYYSYKFYNYPLQFKNALFNLGPIQSALIMASFLYAKVFPSKDERSFEQWVINRFGFRLYNSFFKTYTEKVWGIPCREIRAEWAAQRIKNLSLVSAVLNTIPWRKKSTSIKTLIDEFKYPKYGPGMMYTRIAENIEKNNKDFKVHKKTEVTRLAFKDNKWLVSLKGPDGKIADRAYDYVVSSMPLTALILNMDYDVPAEIREIASKLKYREFLVVCLVFDKKNLLKDTWIYIHEKTMKMGRLQVINNWSPYMVKNPEYSSYGAEYFCTEGDSTWNMPDDELIKLAIGELKGCKLVPEDYNCIQGHVVRVKKTYPVYDEYYGDNIAKVINFMKTIPHLQAVGRYGMFKYNNMDHSIYTGILAAKNIIAGYMKYDVWKVNQDEEYHETVEEKDKKSGYEVYESNPPLK